VQTGLLRCTVCAETYPIDNGIIDFLKQESGLSAPMKIEVAARDRDVDRYDEHFRRRNAKEVPSTMKRLGDVSGKMLIEYGCGTGRFTTQLQAAGILGVDFSLASLRHLQSKLTPGRNVGLVRAEASTFRVRRGFFDLALAAQVLEHFPDEFQWRQLLSHLSHTLLPGGRLVASVYHFDLRRRFRRVPQVGYHHSGIFCQYFTRSELYERFAPFFADVRIEHIDIELPVITHLSFDPATLGAISRAFEKVPGFNQLSHLLLVTARR
jgi:SAM-dependent methyltransferase